MDPTIVLLEHREDFRAIYALNLYVYLGARVVVATTVKDAIDQIKGLDIALVFVDTRAYVTDIAFEIYRHIQSHGLKIPLFVIGKTDIPHAEATVFDSNIQLKDILKNISKSLSITAKLMAEKKVPEYFPLPVEHFLPGWYCATELYTQQAGDDQYLPAYSTEDVITQETLETLESNNQKFLYVQSKSRLRFVNSITGQIVAKLNDANLSAEERVKTTATAYQMSMEQARSTGVTETVLELVNSCIDSMVTTVTEIPSLKKLLELLFSDTLTQRYRLSLLVSYVGGHIIKHMQWGSREQQQKLVYASFFSNIFLVKDEFLLLRSDAEVDASGLSAKDKNIVKNHALFAAKLASQVHKAPIGVDAIIKQHHGSKSGNSLSELSPSISPLAIVLIIAEEWALAIMKNQEMDIEQDSEAVIQLLKAKYTHPTFAKVIPALEGLDL